MAAGEFMVKILFVFGFRGRGFANGGAFAL
jgi:hypothetical protein